MDTVHGWYCCGSLCYAEGCRKRLQEREAGRYPMPINIVDLPAAPHCAGKQWFVADLDRLAHLAALVLLGRAHHAGRILEGAQRDIVVPHAQLKARLQRDLFPPEDVDPWHRDGLLFEVICWLVARMSTCAGEVISDPHLKSTQQGADMIKVEFDEARRTLVSTTIYEYKCTDYARRCFKGEILPAFAEYISGARDDQLAQTTIGLLVRFGLTDDEHVQIYDKLINDRPLAFRAALTVSPEVFGAPKCVKLFKDYESVPTLMERRFGDTFPLANIRAWFNDFAVAIWDKIEAMDV